MEKNAENGIPDEQREMPQEKSQEEQREKSVTFGGILKSLYSMITMLAVLLSLTAATYAWFSSNSIVNTDRVSGRSGTDLVKLEISPTGGNDFNGGQESALIQVNANSSERLMPVSTADLYTFVSSPGTIDGEAVYFEKVQGERYYYHGRVYLRATSQGHAENAKLALYLDGSQAAGGNLMTSVKGALQNAGRLGLTFDGGGAKILRLSEEGNAANGQNMNVKLNGVAVQAGQVINGSADPFQIVADPSAPIGQYMVGEDGLTGSTSLTPLLMMELNRIYMVDVYFYLEGCDPDCTDIAKLDSLNLHLAFYGVLTEEAN
jgi:hypothetical protein